MSGIAPANTEVNYSYAEVKQIRENMFVKEFTSKLPKVEVDKYKANPTEDEKMRLIEMLKLNYSDRYNQFISLKNFEKILDSEVSRAEAERAEELLGAMDSLELKIDYDYKDNFIFKDPKRSTVYVELNETFGKFDQYKRSYLRTAYMRKLSTLTLEQLSQNMTDVKDLKALHEKAKKIFPAAPAVVAPQAHNDAQPDQNYHHRGPGHRRRLHR